MRRRPRAARAQRVAALVLGGALLLSLVAEGADVVRSRGRGGGGGVIEGMSQAGSPAVQSPRSNSPGPAASAPAPPAAAAPSPSAGPSAPPTATAPATAAPDRAVGFGAGATGGAGREIVEVVNLRDNPPELGPWPGSLRAALTGGNRIVEFRVSGSIELLQPLRVAQRNVTIDGTHAPDGGVALHGAPLLIDADNVIVRNLRFRGSHPMDPVDGLEIAGGSDILIDHVSCSWATDECISLYGYSYTGRGSVSRVTIQNSLIAEAPVDSPYGILIDGDVGDVTLYRNVFAKNANRNPQITTGHRGAGEDGGAPVLLAGVGRYELIQNVIYDAVYATRIWNQSPDWTIQLDVIGNLWKPGLRYPRPKVPVMIFTEPESLGAIQVFLADNAGPDLGNGASGRPCDYFSREAANRPCAGYAPAHAATARLTRSEALPGRPASQDFEVILASAGATRPCRDAVDRRVVEEVRTGTGRPAIGPGRLPSLDGACQ